MCLSQFLFVSECLSACLSDCFFSAGRVWNFLDTCCGTSTIVFAHGSVYMFACMCVRVVSTTLMSFSLQNKDERLTRWKYRHTIMHAHLFMHVHSESPWMHTTSHRCILILTMRPTQYMCRLSTIRNADLIVAFKKGEVVEKGTHNALIQNPDGFYSKLVHSQMNAH